MRNECCRVSTIRLGKTKNNREECVQFGKNLLAERALRFALQLNGHLLGKPLFGFKKYSEIYSIVRDFNTHFGVNVHITPHSLRAGGATFYKMQNMSLEEIALIGSYLALAQNH